MKISLVVRSGHVIKFPFLLPGQMLILSGNLQQLVSNWLAHILIYLCGGQHLCFELCEQWYMIQVVMI